MGAGDGKLIEAKDAQGREFAYTKLGELGQGAFSHVLLVERRVESTDDKDEDRRLEKLALKIASKDSDIRALEREAKLLVRIRESADERRIVSRVVRIRGEGGVLRFEDPLPCALIELEYLDGTTLRSWIEREKWFVGEPTAKTILKAVDLGIDLAQALQEIALVDDGVLHRDIKPANIMYTSSGLRLFDFGVGRSDGGDKTLTEYVGTKAYMAPEVWHPGDYDRRADLYSFGVLLHELVSRKSFRPAWMQSGVAGGPPLGSFENPAPQIAALTNLPSGAGPRLEALFAELLVDADRRLRDPSELVSRLEEVRRLLSPRMVAPTPAADADALAGLDLIELVSELRPDGLLSVVADSPEIAPGQRELRRRLQVDDPLEDLLLERIRDAARAKRRTLIVLAGNAGDGKSHLIDRVLHHRLAQEGDVAESVRYIADATHADKADQSQHDRLAQFFAPFAEGGTPCDEPVSVIAMNTGMVLRFFEEAAERHAAEETLDLSQLFSALEARLGLRRTEPPDLPFELLVVNLDLRDLLAAGHADHGPKSFFERMLDRLDPTIEDGLIGALWDGCEACPARSVCSVHFNLESLRTPRVRTAVCGVLERAALDPEVHLSPRLLWSLIYRLVTGGIDHFDLPNEGVHPCEVVRRRAEDSGWLIAHQFTQIPFAREDLPDVPVWRALRRLDPALSGAPALDRLHTRFAIQSYQDDSTEEIGVLGGDCGTLAGLDLQRLLAVTGADVDARRDAAVRRRVFFDVESYEAYAGWGAGPRFVALTETYAKYSRLGGQALSEPERTRLTDLTGMVRDVFLKGAGQRVGGRRFLRVSQPNPDANTHLLVEVDDTVLGNLFRIKDLIVTDVHAHVHAEDAELIDALGYHCRQLTLSVGGHRLIVDLDLFEFLEAVGQGKQPSRRDLAQFETLIFLGEHLGNSVAKQPDGGTLFIRQDAEDALYRLSRDDFGTPRLTREAL